MKMTFVIAAAMGLMVASAARAEQGPPSMSSAQAAAYAACIKKVNKETPDWNPSSNFLAKQVMYDRCAMGGK